jgi:outer membrane protein
MASKASLLASLALALLAVPLAAQPAARPFKAAIIDPERVMLGSARGKQAYEPILKRRDEGLAQRAKMRQDLEEIQKRIADGRNSLGTEKLKQLQDEAEGMQIALERFSENLQREVGKLEQERMEPIEKELIPVINEVAREQGYTMVFKVWESGLVFADPAVDITELVIQRFDARAGAAAPGAKPAATPTPKPAATPKPPGH